MADIAPVTSSSTHQDEDEDIDTCDNINTILENKTNNVWHFGNFQFTSDALRFVLIYMALMMVLGVGLYNLTVQADMSVKALWAPIVSGSFFCMVPAPSIPKTPVTMFQPAVLKSSLVKES